MQETPLQPGHLHGRQAQERWQWLRGLGSAPLLMLPVVLWLALQILHLTPHAPTASIAARPLLAKSGLGNATKAADANAAEQPPPPQEPDYWQKVRSL